MSLPILLILGAVFAGWSFLSVLGNERQRRVQAQPPRPPKQAAAPAESPVVR